MTDTSKPVQAKRPNLTSQVIEHVKNYMIDHDLGPGDRLPIEKELVAELGISRNVLREGLKSLEALGLIEIRVGDGMYVCPFDYTTLIEHMSFAVSRTKQELTHLMYARLAIEVGALQQIVDNIQEEDIPPLLELLDRYDGARELADCHSIDLEFHQKLLAISRNPILAEFGVFLGRFFMESFHFWGENPKPRTGESHRALIEALRQKDLAKATEIMRQHILTWDTNFAIKIGQFERIIRTRQE